MLSVTSGTVPADVAWLEQNTPTGLRGLFGVDVDLLDTFGILFASDIFLGLANGQATSRVVATGLAPGDYVLRLTANTTGDAMYRIDLGTSATRPTRPPARSRLPGPSWQLQSWPWSRWRGAGAGAARVLRLQQRD